jgi:PhoH-like ATPase
MFTDATRTDAPDLSDQTQLAARLGKATGKKPRAGGRIQRDTGVKTFVLDTNVLLHDPACVQKFEDNAVCIPVDVLSELDRFKNEMTERGANAREVHRSLSRVFAAPDADVLGGVRTAGGGSLRLVIFDPELARKTPALQKFQRVFPELEKTDHRILACALWLAGQDGEKVILVSKDLNMQLKARAVGVECEDYLHDKVEARDVANLEIPRVAVTAHELQRFGSSGRLSLEPSRLPALVVNEYVLLATAEKSTMPARFNAAGEFVRLRVPESLRIQQGRAVKPMNLGQQCYLDALMDPGISLVTAFGQAGTGKTLIAVAAGLSQVFSGGYTGLTVSRPIVAMGQGIGFLPGSLQEKMRPWLQPVYDALDFLMRPVANPAFAKKKPRPTRFDPPAAFASAAVAAPYDPLVQSGIIEIEALCYIRGRSIPERFFILDESQQLTPLEAKTVVTRMSRGSKLVLVGDPGQIDNPYVDSRSNGLVYTRQRLRGQPFAAHIPLVKGERSAMAEAGARLM